MNKIPKTKRQKYGMNETLITSKTYIFFKDCVTFSVYLFKYFDFNFKVAENSVQNFTRRISKEKFYFSGPCDKDDK